MEGAVILGLRAIATIAVLGVLAGCSGEPADRPGERPRLGADEPVSASPTAEAMDPVESAVAARLASRLEDDGLVLQHVDCPRWQGDLPATLDCEGYVDGVVGAVRVELSDGGGGVEYDARLEGGVVATARLVRSLEEQGMSDVDCGGTPAYPARPGMEIVCRVVEQGDPSYVVATVVDRTGAVEIEDY